jgi:hypothetical protein
MILLVAVIGAVVVTAVAVFSEGPWGLARIPGSVIGRLGNVAVFDLDLERQLFWLSNILFWTAIIYGCVWFLRGFFTKGAGPSKQDRLRLPWLAAIVLFVFSVFFAAAQLHATSLISGLLKPVEFFWGSYGISNADPVLFASISFWTLLVYGLVRLIESLVAFRRL